MHKPLDLPLRTRVWHFLRGLLFYNTVYWKRASDELNPPKLSRQERQRNQPTRDFSIIRPREKPRPGLDQMSPGDVSHFEAVIAPPGDVPTPAPAPPSPTPAWDTVLSLPSTVEPEPSLVDPEVPAAEVMVKRRRYRRRRRNGGSTFSPPGTDAGKAGLIARLFGR